MVHCRVLVLRGGGGGCTSSLKASKHRRTEFQMAPMTYCAIRPDRCCFSLANVDCLPSGSRHNSFTCFKTEKKSRCVQAQRYRGAFAMPDFIHTGRFHAAPNAKTVWRAVSNQIRRNILPQSSTLKIKIEGSRWA